MKTKNWCLWDHGRNIISSLLHLFYFAIEFYLETSLENKVQDEEFTALSFWDSVSLGSIRSKWQNSLATWFDYNPYQQKMINK